MNNKGPTSNELTIDDAAEKSITAYGRPGRKAMRPRTIVFFAVLILVSLQFSSFGTEAAAEDEGLRLYEVIPWGKAEGVSLHNYGTRDVDLRNYFLDDGEGTVRFSISITVVPGASVTILASQPEKWVADGRNVFVYGENGITAKNFQLNDRGDDISLKTASGVIVDAFVYGTGPIITGWVGDPFRDIPNNKIAKRTSIFDSDSAKDWSLITPGQTSFPERTFTGTATPFLFPDSKGMPLLGAMAGASSEILISIYEFDHPDIASLLLAAIGRGVSVKILIEGSPVGGIPQSELGILSALYKAGAEISVMKNAEGFRRYSYLHNKYAVIDSEKVIITTENWRASSFAQNRGWGVVIESAGYAEYMKAVFFEDSDPRFGDIVPFISLYPGVLPANVPAYLYSLSVHASYAVTLQPVIAPDFAFGKMNGMIAASSSRVYSEQMTVDISWIDGNTPFANMVNAADRGVDSKIIIDVTFDSPYDNNINDGYQIKYVMRNGSLKIQTSDDIAIPWMIHNKGVVIDNSVWIGSMNWNSSFQNNREIGVVIHSADVADIFASYFMSDWGSYDGTITLSVEVAAISGGIVLDASSSTVPYGTLFRWDLGSDGTIDRTGMKIIVTLPAGTHDCTLYVTDENGVVHEHSFTVHISDGSTASPYVKYLPIAALCVMILAYSLIRQRKKDDHT